MKITAIGTYTNGETIQSNVLNDMLENPTAKEKHVHENATRVAFKNLARFG